jgi:hypothetical protein
VNLALPKEQAVPLKEQKTVLLFVSTFWAVLRFLSYSAVAAGADFEDNRLRFKWCSAVAAVIRACGDLHAAFGACYDVVDVGYRD